MGQLSVETDTCLPGLTNEFCLKSSASVEQVYRHMFFMTEQAWISGA